MRKKTLDTLRTYIGRSISNITGFDDGENDGIQIEFNDGSFLEIVALSKTGSGHFYISPMMDEFHDPYGEDDIQNVSREDDDESIDESVNYHLKTKLVRESLESDSDIDSNGTYRIKNYKEVLNSYANKVEKILNVKLDINTYNADLTDLDDECQGGEWDVIDINNDIPRHNKDLTLDITDDGKFAFSSEGVQLTNKFHPDEDYSEGIMVFQDLDMLNPKLYKQMLSDYDAYTTMNYNDYFANKTKEEKDNEIRNRDYTV